MKLMKKVLSGFLAVIMIISSLSICFGSLGAADNADWSLYNKLAIALKNNILDSKSVTYENPDEASTGTTKLEITDHKGYFTQAMSAWWSVFKAVREDTKSNTTNVGNYRLSSQINRAILDKLISDGHMTEGEISAYRAEEALRLFVANIIPDDTLFYGDWPLYIFLSNPSGVVAETTVKLDITSYLKQFASVDEVPDTITTKAYYYVNNSSDGETKADSGRTAKKIRFNRIKESDLSHESVSDTLIKAELTEAYEIISLTYGDYFELAVNDDIASLVHKGKTELEYAKAAINNAYSTIIGNTSYSGADIWEHFFSAYDAVDAVEDIDSALSVHGWKTTADNYKAALKTDYSEYTSTQMFSLWNTLVEYANAINNATYSNLIVSYFDIDTKAAEAVINELKAVYDDKVIAEHRDNALALFDKYKDWTGKMIYDGEISEEELILAVTALDTEYEIFAVCDPATVDRICGEGFMKQFSDIYKRLNTFVNAVAAERNFIEEKNKFDNEVRLNVSLDAPEQELFQNLKNYDRWYSELKDYVKAITDAYGQELADAVMNHYDKVISEHMDAAYKVLSDKSEAQVEIAYEIYSEYVEIYGKGGSFSLINNLMTVYDELSESVGTVDNELYDFLCNSQNDTLSQQTIDKYETMKNIIKAYHNFDETKGFDVYVQSETDDIVRQESPEDIARENDYRVTDEEVSAIIDKIENILADNEIKALLGSLINKDSNEIFDIESMIKNLIEENIYTDAFINNIIKLIYPAVANIFTDVWAGIEPEIDDDEMEVMGQYLDIYVNLAIGRVEDTTAGLGMPIFPTSLANVILAKYPQFSSVAAKLSQANAPAYVELDSDGNPIESTRRSPWNDEVLYTFESDENGEMMKELSLNWGIDEVEGTQKREVFLQAVQAALTGLEPILLALLCNRPMHQVNNSIGSGQGEMGGFYVENITIVGSLTITYAPLNVHSINLALSATANDGYNNVIAPLFELLGATAPDGKKFTSVRDIVEKGVLEPLEQFIAMLSANPLKTVLDVLPNLAYAIEADLILPKLEYLSTQINYSASAKIDIDLNKCTTDSGWPISSLVKYFDDAIYNATGLKCESGVIKNVSVDDVMADSLGVEIASFIDVGELLGGADLSSFEGIWDIIGSLLGDTVLPKAPNVQFLATLGELTEIKTVRSVKSYKWGSDGMAAYIKANRADVFLFVIKYIFESGILKLLIKDENSLLNEIADNLLKNSDDSVAAIAELLNQIEYNTLENYKWYDGYEPQSSSLQSDNVSDNNTAEYIYENLENIVGSVIAMAQVDLNKATAEIDGTVEDAVSALINGLFSNKTLTDLARLLSKLELDGVADNIVGMRLSAFADYKDIPDDYDWGVTDAQTFTDALVVLLEPFDKVIDFILKGEDLTVTLGSEKITFIGYEGYNNAIIPLLEALNCKVHKLSESDNALEVILDALTEKLAELTVNSEENPKDGFVYGIIDMIPGAVYFLASNGLSVSIRNLLQPVYVLTDIIRPVYEIDLEKIIGGIEVGINSENKKISLSDIAGFDINKLDITFFIKLLSSLTGLSLTALENAVFDMCRLIVADYSETALSTLQDEWKKGEYNSGFTQADFIQAVLAAAFNIISDSNNAEAVKQIAGEEVYQLILNLCKMQEASVQQFDWKFTQKADTGEVFSALLLSELYKGHEYGPQFTEEKAEYIAENFGEFADNIVYLLGIQVNGKNVDTLKELLKGLINGSVYNSANVIALRDALAAVFADIDKLEINGINAGRYITDILKAEGIADLAAVGQVEVPEFSEDKSMFTEYLCALLRPIYPVLNYILADKDISLLIKGEDKGLISLKGAKGYAYGVVPVLEVLGCKDILTPDEYSAAVEADSDALIMTILNPLLNRIDEILKDDPAQEILDMLANVIYFINSNGVDTVIKNTLNAVYALLSAIEPIAKIDLYELMGTDFATIDFEWIFNKILDMIYESTGYRFTAVKADAINELTVGQLVSYTSKNGETAYKMIYTPSGTVGGKAEMTTVIMRLLVTFIMHENNREMLLGLLRDNFNMTAETEKYVSGIMAVVAESATETKLGMDAALAMIYYLFYSADIGAGNTATGIKDLNAEWTKILREMIESKDEGKAMAGKIIAGILDLDIFEDIVDSQGGIAPNGLLKFFQKIAEWFRNIGTWFSNLFS